MPTVTNIIASQALRGQSVKITINVSDPDQFDAFRNLEAGFMVSSVGAIDPQNQVGIITSIDKLSNYFMVEPLQPNLSFNGGARALFLNNSDVETI